MQPSTLEHRRFTRQEAPQRRSVSSSVNGARFVLRRHAKSSSRPNGSMADAAVGSSLLTLSLLNGAT